MGIGNFGMWEMLVVGLIVLIFFGPRRLPEIARSAGKAMREFKRGMNEIQRELEIAEREDRKATPPAGRAASTTPDASPATSPAASPDTTTPSIQPPIPTFAGAAAAASGVTARPAEEKVDPAAESGLYDGTQVDVGGEPTRLEPTQPEAENEPESSESRMSESTPGDAEADGADAKRAEAEGEPPAPERDSSA
jgi:sec-independent protein translocase protein TatA